MFDVIDAFCTFEKVALQGLMRIDLQKKAEMKLNTSVYHIRQMLEMISLSLDFCFC